MPRKRKKALPPRRKRMKREARLQSAKHWLASFRGKNVIRSYAKWFGVDLGRAIKELEVLGVPLDQTYVQQLRTTLQQRAKSRKTAKEEARRAQSATRDELEGYGEWWDDEFAFIAGRTGWGFPYGIRWEELPERASLGRGQRCPATSGPVTVHGFKDCPVRGER